jgi:hypothetical protein
LLFSSSELHWFQSMPPVLVPPHAQKNRCLLRARMCQP